jgi:hypothetical protein
MSSWASTSSTPFQAASASGPSDALAAASRAPAVGGADAGQGVGQSVGAGQGEGSSLWSSIAGYVLLMLISAALTAAFVSWRMELKPTPLAQVSPLAPASAHATHPAPSPATTPPAR